VLAKKKNIVQRRELCEARKEERERGKKEEILVVKSGC